jgi:hypothetical protein
VLGLGVGNLFPLGLSFTVSLAPDRAQLASARLATVTAIAVLVTPLAVGGLADATSLTAAVGVVPLALVLAAAGLTAAMRGYPMTARTAPSRAVRRPRASGAGRSG